MNVVEARDVTKRFVEGKEIVEVLRGVSLAAARGEVVAQTLYASTMEHIKEFGTVKAIGGGNFDIYRILGKQASIAAVAGFVLGALMAFAMRPAIAKIDLKLIIPPAFAATVFVGAIVMCLAAAVISFRKVAGIDPALVFRG